MKQFLSVVAVAILQAIWLLVCFAVWITVSTINAVRYITQPQPEHSQILNGQEKS